MDLFVLGLLAASAIVFSLVARWFVRPAWLSGALGLAQVAFLAGLSLLSAGGDAWTRRLLHLSVAGALALGIWLGAARLAGRGRAAGTPSVPLSIWARHFRGDLPLWRAGGNVLLVVAALGLLAFWIGTFSFERFPRERPRDRVRGRGAALD
jgi:hypothetical protein